MRLSWLALVLLFTATVYARAQWPPCWRCPSSPPPDHVEHALTLGLWDEYGVQGKLGPGVNSLVISTAGAYMELSHRRLRPAVEVRGTYTDLGVRGTLVGPRVAWKIDQVIFFASGLFGPNHSMTPDYGPNPGQDLHGITSEAAAGMEIMSRDHPNWGFRVETTTGRFTGMPQSYPLTIAAGITLRVP